MGINPMILEASNEIGGRISTSKEFSVPVDLGASIITGIGDDKMDNRKISDPSGILCEALGIEINILNPERLPMLNPDTGITVPADIDKESIR